VRDDAPRDFPHRPLLCDGAARPDAHPSARALLVAHFPQSPDGPRSLAGRINALPAGGDTAGVLLLIGYPYKAFTNPVFYVKLMLIAVAVYLIVRIRKDVLLQPDPDAPDVYRRGRLYGMISLGCWVGVILAGRLLAYTYTWLRVGMPNNF